MKHPSWRITLLIWLTVTLIAVGGAGTEALAEQTSENRFDRFQAHFEGHYVPAQPRQQRVADIVKKIRLIVNDDGDAQYPQVNARAAEGAEGFLSARFASTVGTKVDAYFFCVGNGEIPPWGLKTPEAIGDANQVMIEAARRAGMKIFASLRMNDIHDAWAAKLTYPLKVRRPDLLIGNQYWPEGYPHLLKDEQAQPRGGYPADALLRAFWSAFDYAKPEVRQHRLRFIRRICRKYDFDGFELDFFRHPLFFKLGEEYENLDTMTEFVGQVRQLLNQIGRMRGRPYVLAVRVPDSPAMALRTGLDVEEWLRQGLVDMLVVGGGYMPYSGRLKEFIDMAHRYGIPAYPCINHFQEPIKMRSYASNFWALGADGVYLFNFGGAGEGTPQQACLSQMQDPDVLRGLDKLYLPDNGCSIFYTGYANPSPQFPVRLVWGKPIELVVGDDLQQAAREGLLGEVLLQIKVSNLAAFPELNEMILKNEVLSDERIAIQINGSRIPDQDIKRVDNKTFVASVTAPPLKRGINQIVVLHGPNSVGALSATVDGIELFVDYKPLAPRPTPSPSASGPDLVLSPTTPMPLPFWNVPVGTSKTVSFDLTTDPSTIKKARLALNAADIDEPAELTITLNGEHRLSIPNSLLSGSDPVQGFIEISPNLLRSGTNNVTFTFDSTLNGTTTGFSVLQAFLVLWLE